jgi:hypothetical protein
MGNHRLGARIMAAATGVAAAPGLEIVAQGLEFPEGPMAMADCMPARLYAFDLLESGGREPVFRRGRHA